MDRRVARSKEDLLTVAELLELSGLEFMEKMRDGDLAAPPIAELMGFHVSEVAPGRVVFAGTPAFDVLNPMRGVHGGYYGTILDSAMGCAVMTEVPKGSVYTTLEYKINITRALPLDTPILCEGKIQHAGRSTAIANGEIRGAENGKLYATGSTTCMIFTPKAA